jgi:hypothetical protein
MVEGEEIQDMDETKFGPFQEGVYDDPSTFLHVQEILEPMNMLGSLLLN